MAVLRERLREDVGDAAPVAPRVPVVPELAGGVAGMAPGSVGEVRSRISICNPSIQSFPVAGRDPRTFPNHPEGDVDASADRR